MRLNQEQIDLILTTIRSQAGTDARVVLFGSRMDDTRRGGDLDLLVESTPAMGLLQRARLKLALEAALHIPVDILAKPAGAAASPFQAIALATGIALQ